MLETGLDVPGDYDREHLGQWVTALHKWTVQLKDQIGKCHWTLNQELGGDHETPLAERVQNLLQQATASHQILDKVLDTDDKSLPDRVRALAEAANSVAGILNEAYRALPDTRTTDAPLPEVTGFDARQWPGVQAVAQSSAVTVFACSRARFDCSQRAL